MWRSVAIGVVLAGMLAGCGVGGGSGGVSDPLGANGYLGASYGAPTAPGNVHPGDAIGALKQIRVQHVIAGAAASPVGKGIRLPDAGGLQIGWVAAGGYGSDSPTPPPGATVGTVQLVSTPSEADAKQYVADHPPNLEPDVNGGTFFDSYRNVIIKVGGTPADAARFELARVKQALARGRSPSSTTTENVPAEKKAIKHEVAKWLSHHPGGHCKVQPPDSADCTAANGLLTMIVVGSDTEIVTNP